jgi:hypothetical protein
MLVWSFWQDFIGWWSLFLMMFGGANLGPFFGPKNEAAFRPIIRGAIDVAIFDVFFVAIFRPSNSARVAASLRKWGRAAPVCAFRLRGGANGGVVAFSLRVCGPANKWVVFQDASMRLFI